MTDPRQSASRYVVLLGAEEPWMVGIFGVYMSRKAADGAALRWNKAHPDDKYGAFATPLQPASGLRDAS